MAEVVIHKCAEKYLPEVVRISNESYKKQRTEKDFKQYMGTFGKFFYVLLAGERVVGFVIVDDNLLKLIAVDKKYRKRGYGRKLMNFILGCSSGLRVRIKASNGNAIKFYDHFGFGGLNRIHAYYPDGDDLVEMVYGKVRTYQ